MKNKRFKVYVDNKLRLICGNQLVLMSNVVSLKNMYGKDRVEVKEYESDIELNKVELQDLKETIDTIPNIKLK